MTALPSRHVTSLTGKLKMSKTGRWMSWSSYADEKMEFLIVRNREALKKSMQGSIKKATEGLSRPFSKIMVITSIKHLFTPVYYSG